MGERKSLAEARESIDDIFRKLEERMGIAAVVRLTPELNAAKSAVFDVVLDQANFDQLWEYGKAPPELMRRVGYEQVQRDKRITAGAYKVQSELMTRFGLWKEPPPQALGKAHSPFRADAVEHDVETRKEFRSQGENNLTPENQAIIYEFRRPKEEAGIEGRPIEFPRDYEVMAIVSGKDAGGETGLYDAMQVAESSGRYLVMKGDVIISPAGKDYRITEDGIRRTEVGIEFTDKARSWEEMPTRSPERWAEAGRPDTAKDSKIAEAVEQDLKTWKAIRSQSSERNGTTGVRETPTREAHER